MGFLNRVGTFSNLQTHGKLRLPICRGHLLWTVFGSTSNQELFFGGGGCGFGGGGGGGCGSGFGIGGQSLFEKVSSLLMQSQTSRDVSERDPATLT